jgi:hypothetical protein
MSQAGLWKYGKWEKGATGLGFIAALKALRHPKSSFSRY